jgi:hypothetical protein
LRAVIAAIEKAHAKRFQTDPKLHELIEAAFNQNWAITYQHRQKIEKSLTAIMSQGNREGEFRVEEPDLAAILAHSACLRFCHPSLSIECPRELDLGVVAAARGRCLLGRLSA